MSAGGELVVPDGETIVFRAAFGEVEDLGGAFLLVGRAGLPENAVLQVTLYYKDRSVGGKRAMVDADGRFDVLLGPYGARRVHPGPYRFEVLFQPFRQPADVKRAEGLPTEPLILPLDVAVGTAADLEASREERKAAYVAVLARLERLEHDMDAEIDPALAKEKYVVGSRKDFDDRAWRTWADAWRHRLDDEVEGPLRRFREDESLTVPMLEAFQTALSLTHWFRELHRAKSRMVYDAHGRPAAPEDAIPEGGSLVRHDTISDHIRNNRKKLAQLIGLELPADEDGEEKR